MAKKRVETYPEQLKKAYQVVMSFPEGMRVMRHLLNVTGYSEPLMMLDPISFEVNQIGSLMNLSKRDVWLEIKKYITPEQQCKIEQPEIVVATEPEPTEEKPEDV